ncbi:MAG: multicopper oxidase family protein [Candidatus Obscuribacterales bacterium]
MTLSIRKRQTKVGLASIVLSIFAVIPFTVPALALDDIGDMAQEQAQEKLELEDMRNEMKDIKGQVRDAMGAMSELTKNQDGFAAGPGQQQMNVREIHLFAREANLEAGTETGANKDTIKALTYNGKIPGPEIHARQGEAVRIILHNNLKAPTSLHFHGLMVPHKVDGLPRAGSSTAAPERFLKPEESFVYQFIANQAGTFFYHPQIIHQDQRFKGMFGAIIVHPRLPTKEVNKELVLFLSKAETLANTDKANAEKTGVSKHVYLINGKTAPFVPALEVLNGERVRLHIINTLDEAVPLHLSGHRFEVTAINGSDPLEPRVVRDTIAVNPSDRIDVEFAANNPGVWSLASELPKQNSNNGKFPGGMAMIVRYSELTPAATTTTTPQ